MTISNDRLFRVTLLIACAGLWVVALPPFARGIIGPAVTRDLVTAGVLSMAAIFHTLSLIVFASVCERSRHPWG